MANSIQRDCLILKILNQRLFQIRVRRSLKRGVEGFDDHQSIIALLIEGKKDLGIAPTAQAALYQVMVVDDAVFQSKLRHLLTLYF
jgi:hypothetical protein